MLQIVKFCSLACIYDQTAAVAFGLADILEMFSKISTLEKNRVSNMKPNSKTVTTNATLIYSVNFLRVELTLIKSRIWAAYLNVKCMLRHRNRA